MTSRITINGISITTSGNNISITNGNVIVDGNKINVGSTSRVEIIGNVGSLNVTRDVERKS